jgi:hypothetical protein
MLITSVAMAIATRGPLRRLRLLVRRTNATGFGFFGRRSIYSVTPSLRVRSQRRYLFPFASALCARKHVSPAVKAARKPLQGAGASRRGSDHAKAQPDNSTERGRVDELVDSA